MNSESEETPLDKMTVTLDLIEAGEQMMRLNLRRRHPGDSEEEIDRRLNAWLEHRPGAEHGDCPGKPR